MGASEFVNFSELINKALEELLVSLCTRRRRGVTTMSSLLPFIGEDDWFEVVGRRRIIYLKNFKDDRKKQCIGVGPLIQPFESLAMLVTKGLKRSKPMLVASTPDA